MTVVARGAALYAATVERKNAKTSSTARGDGAQSGKQRLTLAYDPVSAQTSATVGGRLEGRTHSITELNIETEGGVWASGWFRHKGGVFETSVVVQEGRASRFFVYARDAKGTLVDIEPNEFTIRHGLVVAPPPLPHSISLEVARPNGKKELDVIFARGTPLPAERTARYRSERACKPGDAASSLAIKLWEGEDLGDPEANDWVGIVKIDAQQIRRSIPEGSEVELTIKIDTSRLITVEAFIKHLNQHFAEKLFVPLEEEQDYSNLSSAVPTELGDYSERLEQLRALAEDEGNTKQVKELDRLSDDLDDLGKEARKSTKKTGDPDAAKRVVEASRTIRSRLNRLEKDSGVGTTGISRVAEFTSTREAAHDVVARFGSTLEKKELQMLDKHFERALGKADESALGKVGEAFDSLRWRVLFAQEWWWREVLEGMKQEGRTFLNRQEAEELFRGGEQAIRAGDGSKLQEVVRKLWKLQPKGQVEADQDRAMRSGLRRY